MAHYDVIVAGIGAMGSAAAHELARRGQRVLGLERFDIPHAMGSSHGINRIIRLAYFEHPLYVPLLRRAYELWRETETAFGEQLLHITGGLDAGPLDSRVVSGSLAACREHDLPHELMDAAETHRRFPGYRLAADHVANYQADAGFVMSERAIVAHVTMAMAKGAEIRAREPILSWEPTAGGGVRVTTGRATYEAGRLILSTGAWIGDHVPALTRLAVPERQVLGWFQPKVPAHFALGAFPSPSSSPATGPATSSRSSACPDSRSASTITCASMAMPTRCRASRPRRTSGAAARPRRGLPRCRRPHAGAALLPLHQHTG